MKAKLRNITVTLEAHVVRWVRTEAARKQTSVSGLLGEIPRQNMPKEEGYESAMRRALERKPFLNSKGRHMFRADADDRARSN
jgi:hypothetical protein